uniref:Dickkopf WNT signaling pathway inhibitor 3a n=1 Tax=Astyanax mexicanus TaxID=7994 RepID=A0A3B1KLH3_ASTMX
MHVLELSVLVAVAGAIVTPNVVHEELNGTVEADGARGQTALGDMFREVEELMEDTQHRLEDTVHQMDNESAKSSQPAQNLTSNYSSDTQFSFISLILSPPSLSLSLFLSLFQECIIDEDCEKGTYCLYEAAHSECLDCKDVDATCTKDVECCDGQLCVWGQCTKNATKGEPGTICEYQSNCSGDLCCTFHKALLFPVCITKPTEHQRCIIAASHLMELLSWDLEGEGPTDHCPCAGDLQCQNQGRGALCFKSQSSSEEDETDAIYSEIDYIL